MMFIKFEFRAKPFTFLSDAKIRLSRKTRKNLNPKELNKLNNHGKKPNNIKTETMMFYLVEVKR